MIGGRWGLTTRVPSLPPDLQIWLDRDSSCIIWFNPSIAHQYYRRSEAVFEPHLSGLHHIRTTLMGNYPMSESEASAQITGISGGFIGTLRLSERTGKDRMVCTITMAGVEELESRELL